MLPRVENYQPCSYAVFRDPHLGRIFAELGPETVDGSFKGINIIGSIPMHGDGVKGTALASVEEALIPVWRELTKRYLQ